MLVGLSTVLLGGAVTACQSGPSAKSIVDNAITNSAGVKSYKSVVSTSMTVEITSKDGPITTSIGMDGMGFTDVTLKQSRTVLDFVIQDGDQPEQKLALDIYETDQWRYIKIPTSDTGEEWVKVRISPDGAGASGQMVQQVDLLKTAKNAKIVDSEVVGGDDCYVLEMKPDAALLLGTLLRQSQSHFTVGIKESDFSEFDFTKIVKSVTLKQWISKRDSSFRKVSAEILMEMKPEDFKNSPGDFEKISFSLNMGLTFLNHNEPVDAAPPEEALQAQEMTLQ